jgi:hypothetical protein
MRVTMEMQIQMPGRRERVVRDFSRPHEHVPIFSIYLAMLFSLITQVAHCMHHL